MINFWFFLSDKQTKAPQVHIFKQKFLHFKKKTYLCKLKK